MNGIKFTITYRKRNYEFEYGSQAYIFHTGIYKGFDKRYGIKILLEYVALVHKCYLSDSNRTPLGATLFYIYPKKKFYKGDAMKNTKEIQAILTAIFCLNRTGNEDKDITLILDYAFGRLFGANTNLLLLACIGQTRESMATQVMELLEQETQYKKYLENNKK